MSEHTPGIAGWSEQESMGVLAAMADVIAKGRHDDDKAARLITAVGDHVFGVDEVLLDRPAHPATSS